MGKPKAPSPPDPVTVSNAQAAANAETARLQGKLNRLDETTPWGSVKYSETGPDQYARDIMLNPQDQQALDLQRQIGLQLGQVGQAQLGRIGNNMNTPWSYEGLPEAPGADNDARVRYEEALMSRLSPQFERDQENLRTRLLNQGHTEGSAGYNQGMDEFNRARTDARMQAILSGGDEMARQFGLQQSARQQGIQERAYERGLPLNELATLLGSSPQLQAPNFGPIPQVGVQPTDVVGANAMGYQGALNNYNAKMQNYGAGLGGLFGLGGAFLGSPTGLGWLSMREVKNPQGEATGIVDKIMALPVERWTYKGDPATPHIGPYAQDFRDTFGVGDGIGIRMVDAVGVLYAAVKELALEVRALKAGA